MDSPGFHWMTGDLIGTKVNLLLCILKPAKHEFLMIMFKNAVPTQQKIFRVCIREISRLVLFRKIAFAYSETHARYEFTLCGQTADI